MVEAVTQAISLQWSIKYLAIPLQRGKKPLYMGHPLYQLS